MNARPVPPWLKAARELVGLSEIVGPKHDARILRMWEAIKAPFREDETPWCAGFVGAVLEWSDIRSTRSAAARSYLAWGIPLAGPVPGAVVIFSRPGSSWSGHVSFVEGRDLDGRIMCLGGNQGNKVSIAPFAAARVIGYRWPRERVELLPYDQRFAALPLLGSTTPSSTNEA
jgi:uncharacterized protein (TIGR02594 family)